MFLQEHSTHFAIRSCSRSFHSHVQVIAPSLNLPRAVLESLCMFLQEHWQASTRKGRITMFLQEHCDNFSTSRSFNTLRNQVSPCWLVFRLQTSRWGRPVENGFGF